MALRDRYRCDREEIAEETVWAMLFADDLVLCDPDRETAVER